MAGNLAARILLSPVCGQDAIFWNGPGASDPTTDFDHVFASKHPKFKDFGNGAEVAVRGWPDEPTDTKKGDWITKYSDHAMLYGELHS